MFGRQKSEAETPPTAPESTISAADVGQPGTQPGAGGKGRPTPKRKEAEALNRRPLVHNDKKVARAEQRRRNAEARQKQNQAMLSGDEAHMPLQHRGKVRRFARDYIDARWSLGEFFLPLAFVFLVLSLLANSRPELGLPILLLLYVLIIVAAIDAVLAARRIRKLATAKYGADQIPRGFLMYCVVRAFQLKRSRMPKPQVARGEFPS